MEFFTTTSAASRRAGGCIVVGVYEKGKLGRAAADIDASSKGLIKRHIKDGDISGRAGTSLLLPAVPGVRSQRVLVVGLGKSSSFGVTQFRPIPPGKPDRDKPDQAQQGSRHRELPDARRRR
jgi:leucyl aminopeptidase